MEFSVSRIGLATEFSSEKIPRNRLGLVSVNPLKKVLILRHSEFSGRAIQKLGIERLDRNFAKKFSFMVQSKYWTKLLLTRVVETNSYDLYKNSQFVYCQRLLLLRFVPSCFRTVWNRIPRVCFYFRYTDRNSKLFSLPLMDWEGNSESLLLFLVHGTEFRVVFSSAEGFGTEFREFSLPQNSRDSIGNNHLFHLFCLPRNYFFVGNSHP